MNEEREPQNDEPREGYEPPAVEQVDTQDEPAVVAAGNNSNLG